MRQAGAWKTSGIRTRVVLTGCVGACPKKGITVAAATDGGAIRRVAFGRHDDAGAAVDVLFDLGPRTDLLASGDPGRAHSKSTSDAPSST